MSVGFGFGESFLSFGAGLLDLTDRTDMTCTRRKLLMSWRLMKSISQNVDLSCSL